MNINSNKEVSSGKLFLVGTLPLFLERDNAKIE